MVEGFSNSDVAVRKGAVGGPRAHCVLGSDGALPVGCAAFLVRALLFGEKSRSITFLQSKSVQLPLPSF